MELSIPDEERSVIPGQKTLTDSVCCSSHSWLLQDPEMQLRTTYKGFTEAVDAYFDHLMPIVVPLQASTIHHNPLGGREHGAEACASFLQASAAGISEILVNNFSLLFPTVQEGRSHHCRASGE